MAKLKLHSGATKMGTIDLNTASGTKTFDIYAVCGMYYDKAYGYLIVNGLPIVSLNFTRNNERHYVLNEGSLEKAQSAYDSFIKSDGKYNFVSKSEDVQSLDFESSLLAEAEADVYDFFGVKHIVIQNKQGSKNTFHFNVWDHDLMKLVYNEVIKPTQISNKCFDAVSTE